MEITDSVRFLISVKTQAQPGCDETDCRLQAILCDVQPHQQSNPREPYRGLRWHGWP